LGGGLGNEVAAALRRGAVHVDVVDLDPAYAEIGSALHPEKPFDDERVTFHAADARVFLRNSAQQYDLILYTSPNRVTASTWAPHATAFGFTAEAFHEARARLRQKGMIALSFPVLSNALGAKLFTTLKQAFDGKPPTVVQSGYQGGVLFLAGEGAALVHAGPTPPPDLSARYAVGGEVSTDNWPFFAALPLRVFPVSLTILLGILAVFSAGILRYALPSERRSGMGLSFASFFCAGVGAVPLLTGSFIEAGWWLGSGWPTVFAWLGAGALSAALAGWVVERWWKLSPALGAALVALGLVLSWWVQGARESLDLPRLLALAAAFSPVLMSSFFFASLLREHTAAPVALTWMLLGACTGAGLEHSVMYFGLHSRPLLAFVATAAAYLCIYFQKRGTRSQSHRGGGRMFLKKASSHR
ncbi:hypothetical protein K2X33_00835, partial [bacterium]|nr:hypothetical protein [bacterium]